MAGWTFFLAILVSLQVVQDGVHSCTLRSHKAPGPQSACSTPGAADPSPAIPRRTPASCATPSHGLHYPDALNKIPSITSSLSNPVPAAALPPVPVPLYLAPVSASTSGPGSDLLNPAVPSDRLLPSLSPAPPAHTTTPLPATVSANAVPEAVATEATATAPVDESSKSTSGPETVPAALPSSFPATDSANSVPTNDAVQPSDPGSVNVPAASAPINASDSTLVAPEASGPALEAIPAPATNTLSAADSVPASTSADVVSSAPPPSDITTPSIV